MIGATTSQTLDLTLINKGDMIYGTSTIKVEIGLKVGSTIEYIPMGIYNIDNIEKTDYTIKITAFDNMIKFERNFSTNLGENLTLQQVVSELERITGVQFTGSLPSYTVKKLEGFTCREILGYVASLCGGNAVITREGKFTIVTPNDINYSINASNYFEYTREETKYKIGKISCQVGEEVLSEGILGTDSMELQFENPWVTNSILQDIYNKLNGFEYLGYSMKWQGDFGLDLGDIVTITDKKGVVRKHPILSQKFNYTGGLTSEISAKGENKNKNEFSSSGSTSKKVERVVMELALINKALIDVAYIGDLTAGNIKFDTASGNTLDLQTLLSKFVTGENGQFLNLTTDNVTISNAVIKDIIAKNISVEDLKAGTINTNNINLFSEDGGLSIVGPTMQFKDNNNKVRLQLGKDTEGDFNFILRAADGTTTLIDGYGIKENAIADKLIKSNMVADGAIGEQQINYSSLITGLNKDTNTSLIKASKVALDLTGQSLEVSFNSLKSVADDTKSKTESNTTSINAINGQIATLIIDTTIEEDGATVKLKDSYSNLKQTVSGINATIASHSTSISNLTNNLNAVSGEVTTVNNKVATIETSLNSITSRVSSTENSITTINGNISSLQTRMSTAEQKITDSAIVSTVRSSTSYQNDLNAKASKTDVSNLTTRVNSVEQSITATALTTTISSALNGSNSITTTKFTMNKDGLTIKNGGFKILNTSNAEVFTVTTAGVLTVRGNINVNGYTGESLLVEAKEKIGNGMPSVFSDGHGLGVLRLKVGYYSSPQNTIASDMDTGIITYIDPFYGFYTRNNSDLGVTNIVGGAISATDRLNLGSDSQTNNVGITIRSKADCFVSLYADTDNVDEAHNPYIYFSQDGDAARGIIGFVGNAGTDPMNANYSGTTDNALFMGTKSASPLQFGVNGVRKMTINTDGTVFFSNSVFLPRVKGDSNENRFYVGSGVTRIDTTSGVIRLYTSDVGVSDSGIYIGTDGAVQIKASGVNRHIFNSNGNKTGGSMEIEGIVYGMSPTDSPQSLIEYIIPDVNIEGELKLELDPIYIKMISYYVAFLSNKNIEIIEKGLDYIVLIGNGTTDIMIKGQRKEAQEYFKIMGGFEHGVEEEVSF